MLTAALTTLAVFAGLAALIVTGPGEKGDASPEFVAAYALCFMVLSWIAAFLAGHFA